jgi:alpha-L-rhamnosidase
MFGDKRILEKYFSSMRKWIDVTEKNSVGLINFRARWGDHLSLDPGTPPELVGTAFFAGVTNILSKIAGILGRDGEKNCLDALFAGIKKAFAEKFFNPGGELKVKTQAAAVLPLYFGLVPGSLKKRTVDFLVGDIAQRGTHLSTGYLATPYLLHVLSDNGRADTAYALLNQKTFPSWLYPVTLGHTTCWERWDGWTEEKSFATGCNSLNHYALGAVSDWFYSVVCGVKPDFRFPAFRCFHAAPVPGGGLAYAKMTFDSPSGRIISGWERVDDGLIYTLKVPSGASAWLRLPTVSPDDTEPDTEAAARILNSWRDAGPLVADSGLYRFVIRRPIFYD